MFQILMKRNKGDWLNLCEVNLSEVKVIKQNILKDYPKLLNIRSLKN